MTHLTVLVPAYNEVDRIGATTTALITAARHRHGNAVEVLVIDDGSFDDTALAAEAGGARVIRLLDNQGKGAALRFGVEAARGSVIVFTDADLAFAPEQVLAAAELVADGALFVTGNRRLPESSDTDCPASRRLGSRLINWMSSALVDGEYADMQCGLKAFDAEVARQLFNLTTVSGFALDVELFAAAERLGIDIVEIPVEVQNGGDSSVRIVRDGTRFAVDLLRAARAGRRMRSTIDLADDDSQWPDFRRGPVERRRTTPTRARSRSRSESSPLP